MGFKGRKKIARMLLLTLCLTYLAARASGSDLSSDVHSISNLNNPVPFKMTSKLAHQLINEQQGSLLGDGSQLVSLYYFGQSNTTSVVGLERVGEDYLPIRWLLVFKEQALLGWYYPVGEFPVRFVDGHLTFPKGASDEDIYLFPSPPNFITIEDINVPFVIPSSKADVISSVSLIKSKTP